MVLGSLLALLPVSAFASRAELDGRGLPYLLSVDPSTVVMFPGSAARFGGSALLDYSPYTTSEPSIYDYIYLRPEALRYAGPLVDPVKSSPQRFILGLTGKSLAAGYAMDGKSHNLILSHASGWGISLGIEDKYDEVENYDRDTDLPYSRVRSNSLELSRRDLRFGVGWSSGTPAHRIYEVGATADIVYTQYSTSQLFADVDTTIFSSAEWKSEPGLGIDLRLRTLSPGSGFQGAVRFAYEDLHPDVISGPPTTWIRRYGLAELGWRFGLKELDDLVIGVVMEWSRDTFAGPQGGGIYTIENARNELTLYYGQLFASAERHIVQRLVGRAGVRGSAYFSKQENQESQGVPGSSSETIDSRSQGAVYDPEFFLGAGWTWKRFALDGRLRENIDLDNPVLQWSVGYSW